MKACFIKWYHGIFLLDIFPDLSSKTALVNMHPVCARAHQTLPVLPRRVPCEDSVHPAAVPGLSHAMYLPVDCLCRLLATVRVQTPVPSGIQLACQRSRQEHPSALALATKSKYNKVQSPGYKDLNIIFVLSWMREKRRKKRCWL
jgi:hypothetical protein